MKLNENNLYHVHRKGIMDEVWHIGNVIEITDNFDSYINKKCNYYNKSIIERYKEYDYDIDYIISILEKMKSKNIIDDDIILDFNIVLSNCYILRREQALEEGRKIFNPTAPSRLHCIYLTDIINLPYWQMSVGNNNFETFLLELEGDLFISSDKYFPNDKLMFDIQVEESKKYWQNEMKKSNISKEYLFQGKVKILNKE